jgi:uncharacterized protein involved in exopolysaccharide biosynthesis
MIDPRKSCRSPGVESSVKRYWATFLARWRLLGVPVVLGVVVAVWSVAGAPPSFSSQASLWVDNPGSVGSSLGNVSEAVVPPAQQEQQVLSELLTTREFALAVGHGSLLGQWVGAHPVAGWGPAQLIERVSAPGSVDERIMAALSSGSVKSTVAGPQVLGVSYSSPSAAVARSTLSAIVAQLEQAGPRFAAVHSEAAISYYRGQMQAARQALSAARAQLAAYLATHRGAGSSDPTASSLQQAVAAAAGQLQQANNNLSQAAAATGGHGGGSAVEVIDSPTAAVRTSSNKKRLLAVFGGLFAGALIALLGAIALTPSIPERDEKQIRALELAVKHLKAPTHTGRTQRPFEKDVGR